MKFLKTIRFDPSDMQVFELTAEQNEWAVPGGFLYSQIQDGDLKGKQKQAFSNGFLSVESFGFSTFVSVAEINAEELNTITNLLASQFVEKLGAPSLSDANSVAKEEIGFVSDMCAEVAINSIFAVGRYFDEDGEIREELSIVQAPGEAVHTRVWEVVGD